MRDALHDRVDSREEIAARTRELVKRVVSESLDHVIKESGGDFSNLFSDLAVLVEHEMQGVIKEAVQTGALNAKKRIRASGK